MLDKLLIFLGLKKVPEIITIDMMLNKINNKYHFNLFDENLINEIYTEMLEYGSIKVSKNSEYHYTLSLSDNKSDDMYLCTVTQNGFTYEKIINNS